ncbi:MAG: 2,5-diamino-6-(ribosylamino)-4(3H)-pyrimidinone 5'-phosphate reductase [Chloroflexota bacterium]
MSQTRTRAVTDRPYVLINVAATIDGKIDTAERRGAPISSDADRARVDRLRADVDGVMVGSQTLLDEDPRLIVRTPEMSAERVAKGRTPHPAKVSILSRPDALRPAARFLSAGPARIILFTPSAFSDGDLAPLRERGVEVYTAGDQSGRVDLPRAMRWLGELGLERILVEGGGRLNFELLRLGLVDEVYVFVAPLIFGGGAAPTLADGMGLARPAAIRCGRPEIEAFPDGGVLLRYKVEAP